MNSEPDEPALFDLPLAPPGMNDESGAQDEPSVRRARHRAAKPESLPLFEEGEIEPLSPAERPARYESLPREGEAAPERPRTARERLELVASQREIDTEEAVAAPTAPLAVRLRAGLGDLTVLGATAAVAALGARTLGGSLAPSELPALLTFLLAFSFLYCVVSLAFWGQTPGMAWSGLVARTDETEPLSFGQTALRWLGHWLTWVLLGLPALLALSGRSLADRISGSATYELAPPSA